MCFLECVGGWVDGAGRELLADRCPVLSAARHVVALMTQVGPCSNASGILDFVLEHLFFAPDFLNERIGHTVYAVPPAHDEVC